MNKNMWVGWMLLIALAATACSSGGLESISTTDTDSGNQANQDSATSSGQDTSAGDATEQETDTEPQTDTEPAAPVGEGAESGEEGSEGGQGTAGGASFDGNFCSVARDLDLEDPFADINIFDGEEFFIAVTELWADLAKIVPNELAGDAAVMQNAMDGLLEVGAEYDYDFMDPGFAEALEDLESPEVEEASDNFDRYLLDECGIDSGPADLDGAELDSPGPEVEGLDAEDLADFDNLDDPVTLLTTLFGVDPEVAECLIEELGPEFDIEEPSPELITKELCGTSLLEVLTGAG